MIPRHLILHSRLMLRTGTLLLAATIVAGCAGSGAYREGQVLIKEGKLDAGLAKLEQATREAPSNAEYRIALATQRAQWISRLVMAGEAARREGRLADAERAFKQVQALEPGHAMARQGLEAVVDERRHRQAVSEAEALFKQGDAAAVAAAQEKLRPVLAENPAHRDAMSLKARIEEARAKEQRVDLRLAATYRKPITLEFRDAPLRSVFDIIARVSGLNFFFDKDVRADLRATILAKNTSIEDAVRLLLVTNQLEQKILSENAVLIYPATPQKLKDYQTLAVRTFYLANADVKAVSNSIKTIVKTKDMVIDERLGLIIVRDTPEAVRMAERIVALQDLSDPEVMLDVEVLEVKRSRLYDLGISWPNQLTLAPLTATGTPLSLQALLDLNRSTTQASIGSLAVNVRKEDQDGNILANPRIRVRNREKARILIGDRVPVISTTSTATGFVSEAVNYVDVGLKLEVEPTIYLDEEVAIKINLEVSSLLREVLSKSGTLSYQIGTRNATTVLRLKDGETQILAGLISDEDRSSASRVPGVGDLPLVGRLFGSQKDDTQRSEILLSITPRVVRSIRRPDLLAAEFESGTESSIGSPTLRLSVVEPVAGAASAAATTPLAATGARATPAVAAPVQAIAQPAQPSAAQPSAAVPSTAGGVSMSWQSPTQVKVGEQFSAALRLTSDAALRGMPALVSYDPQLIQFVSIQEGDYFKQARGTTSFSHRVDPTQGKVFLAVVRQASSGAADSGINGNGALVTVTFKAVKAAPSARLQLVSATPEPAPAMPLRLPLEHVIRILP